MTSEIKTDTDSKNARKLERSMTYSEIKAHCAKLNKIRNHGTHIDHYWSYDMLRLEINQGHGGVEVKWFDHLPTFKYTQGLYRRTYLRNVTYIKPENHVWVPPAYNPQ